MTQATGSGGSQGQSDGTTQDKLLERVHAVETAQAAQAAALAGAQATQVAAQAGLTATTAAMQAGTMATMAAGSVGFIAGVFLGLAIAARR
jgi:hypothetical protein